MCEKTNDDAFGYHDFFTTTAGNACVYGVIPGLTNNCLKESCSNDGTCSLHLSQTREQRQTQVTSHEFSEAISDPLLNAWLDTDPNDPSENGDICNGESGSIIVDRSTFGKDEVDALLTLGNQAHVEAAFYVVIDGFTPAQLGVMPASLVGAPNVAPSVTLSPGVAGISVVPTSLVAEDPSLGGGIERFTWVYRVNFTSSAGFPTTVGATSNVELDATMSTVNAPALSVSGSAVLQLIHEPNPYELDGAVSWLSTDMRVFQITGRRQARGDDG